MWKFCRKALFPLSFGQIAQNDAETVPFHNISTTGNLAKLRHLRTVLYVVYAKQTLAWRT